MDASFKKQNSGNINGILVKHFAVKKWVFKLRVLKCKIDLVPFPKPYGFRGEGRLIYINLQNGSSDMETEIKL